MAQTAISRIVVENRWSKFCFISHNIWFVVFDLHNTTSPNSVPKWLINAISQDTKKAWRPTVARSTYWGPRIAQLIRTSNHDPTPICKITPAKLSRCTSLHTHGRLSLLLFLNEFESFLGFQYVKNKARDIRLLNIMVSHTAKKELLPNGIPSGLCATFGVRTLQIY